MRRQRKGLQLLALILGLSLVAAACGGDDDDGDGGSAETGDEGGEEAVAGGEFVDLGTFVGDPPEHIDPALNVTLDAYQVVNSLYDGLTEIDISDPENPEASARWPSRGRPTTTPPSGPSRSGRASTFSDGDRGAAQLVHPGLGAGVRPGLRR